MATGGLPPVSKEQAFLETFFQCINNFAFDKAKDLADKEKSCHRSSPTMCPWVAMVTCLGSLAEAEKAYSSLVFLGFNLRLRILGRKDTLRASFNFLHTEFKRIEESYAKQQGASTLDPVEELLGHLCSQLCHYITARTKTMEFFETMSSSSQFKIMNYEDLHVIITDIIDEHKKCFHHPILSPLKSSFTLECDVISCLLQAQIELQHCQFLPSLLLLHEAHTKLSVWSSALTARESKGGLFGSSSRSPAVPALYQWLVKFKGVLLSKFTLYFYEVLAKQGAPAEVKSCTAKTSVDFISKIQQFHRKSDAFCVTIVYDTSQLPERYEYRGLGYQYPSEGRADKLSGLDSYPAIFTYPEERAEKHWPMVISMMTDHVRELNTCEKIVCFCDQKIQSTYFMTRIEPRLTFVVIFESKKSDRDSYVNNFIHDLCSHLRCTRLFSTLKPK